MLSIIDINENNIDEYDLFCNKSRKGEETYQRKIEWLKNQFQYGLKFKLAVIKQKSKYITKGFIEYVPGEYSWRGIQAKNYMVIHCIWIEQRFQKLGIGKTLLNICMKDSEDLNGVAVIASKDSWLPSENFFIKYGFQEIDFYEPKFKLLVFLNEKDVDLPKFIPLDSKLVNNFSGITVNLSGQCPYSFARVMKMKINAEKESIPFIINELKSSKDTKLGLHPYGTLSIFFNNKFIEYKPTAGNLIKKIKKFNK
ncbi:MAG: GNAT family N-acetyltransferase [Candidatus Thorarchaeota archaeon]